MKVLIGLPNTGTFRKEVVIELVKMLGDSKGHQIGINFETAQPIDNCRNHIVNYFLDGEFDYLLFIDSDNPPINNLLETIELEKDVIVFPTHMWCSKEHNKGIGKIPLVLNVFDWYEEKDKWGSFRKPFEGLQEIDAGGTGAILIKRSVLEKVRPAFMRSWHENGTVDKGSDLLFCKRAKDAGFEVFAHFGYPCRHFKTVDLYEVQRAMKYRDIIYANNENINTEEYWDAQWEKRGERIMPIYDNVIDEIKASKNGSGLRVLDFGCGRGDLLEKVSKIDGVLAQGCDPSKESIRRSCERDLDAYRSWVPIGQYDVIIATEVLEHDDNDADTLRRLFCHANKVIYTVPYNCLPPGLEPEHRRVYDRQYIRRITPHLSRIEVCGDFLMVVAEKPENERVAI